MIGEFVVMTVAWYARPCPDGRPTLLDLWIRHHFDISD